MGVVVVQLGQGGNQFGFSFLDALCSLASASIPPTDFFREPLRPSDPAPARAVLIDTEPKVVAALRRRANTKALWKYRPQNSFTQDSGSGNNWARGYCKHGPKCQDTVMDLIRREVEACDVFGGFITMQSIAGGTGAGLGVYILEVLRDEYPSSCILSHCIWPLDGEVTVQCYNTLLSLAHLQDLADGLLLVRNEVLMATCRKSLSLQRPSFEDMNEVGARALACTLLPSYMRKPESADQNVTKSTRSGTGSCVRVLSDLVSILCAHPKYRMLALRSTPQVPTSLMDFTALSWKFHLKQLKRLFYMEAPKHLEAQQVGLAARELNPASSTKRSDISHRSIDRCLANFLVLRGRDSEAADVSLFNDKAMYPKWAVDPLTVATNPCSLGKYDMSAGLLSNCYSAIAPASHALSRAYAMYSANAYLFQYYEHGLNKDVFEASFATVEDVLAHYSAL